MRLDSDALLSVSRGDGNVLIPNLERAVRAIDHDTAELEIKLNESRAIVLQMASKLLVADLKRCCRLATYRAKRPDRRRSPRESGEPSEKGRPKVPEVLRCQQWRAPTATRVSFA
jgi:hypothetical protein